MITAAALSQFRTEVPACRLAVWSDLRSSTVLAADGDLAYPQEHLDAVAACAVDVFACPGLPDADAEATILFQTPTGLRIFARGHAAPDVALTCLAAPHTDIRRFRADIARFLAPATQ